MNDFDELKSELMQVDFEFEKAKNSDDIMVNVPLNRIFDFASIIQKYLNKPFNYVDVKFPDQKTTVIIFRERIFEIDNPEVDKNAKEWAISIGLPEKEADWPTFYS